MQQKRQQLLLLMFTRSRLAHRAACLEAGTICRVQMPLQARLIVYTAGYIDLRTE